VIRFARTGVSRRGTGAELFRHGAVRQSRREGPASLQKGGFAARLSEIARDHPQAQRFEIWSQDEARVGQKGRTGYVWWQRGHTPRGRRDIGYQSAWIIGAVCPARDTGVALVLTRLDTAATR
jgi:hypothetical protein